MREHAVGKPRLVVHVPSGRNVPSGEPTRLARLTEFVRAVVADSTIDDILTEVGVTCGAEEGSVAAVGPSIGEVVGVFLALLLEEMPVDKRNITIIVADTPALVVFAAAFDVAHCETTHHVEDVSVVESLVVLGSCADIELRHREQLVIHDTAFREHGLGESVRLIGVGIKIRVAVTDSSVLGVNTGAISHRLVGVVLHIVVLRRLAITIGSDTDDFKTGDRTPVDFALEFKVGNTYIYIVVVELAEDIEVGIVTSESSSRVGNTRSVQRITERVDIETTVYLTTNDIDILAEGTRRSLFTIRVAGEQLHAESATKFIRSIGVESVAVNLALFVPSRVVHNRSRSVETAFIGTAGDAHRVVLHHVAVEKEVKPIGVTELSLTEVVIFSLGGIWETILAIGVTVDEFVHCTIYTRRGRRSERSKFEPALLLHFLVNTHLLLRVTDVILAVTWFKSVGKFACIFDACVTGATLLCINNDHTRHSARTINRSCRTILEDLETLDVVGVKTGNSRSDKGFGITRRKFVGADFHSIFKNHTINNPKRLGSTVD